MITKFTVTDTEKNEYAQLINDARQDPANIERSKQLKEAYIAEKAIDYASHHKVSVDDAIEQIRGRMKGQEHGKVIFLGIDDMVYVDANKQLSGAELIKRGEQYDGRSIPDPIEGPKYGLSTAIFNNGRIPRIHSFAHGQETVYELLEFSRIEPEAVGSEISTNCEFSADPNKSQPSHPLAKYSLAGKSAELEKQLKDDTFVFPKLALRGQATVIFSQPNTGKTLLSWSFLLNAIASKSINPSHVYYLNADDTFSGLTQKAGLADDNAFHMLAPGLQEFKTEDLLPLVSKLIKSPECEHTIIVLDTLKKFVDPMNKTDSRKFWMIIRMFVSNGGTLIALAHVNKNRDSEGKAVPAGTSDTIDDADCAYILDAVEPDDPHNKIVVFENIKNRGAVAQRLAFKYSIRQEDSYLARLASVTEVDPELADQLRTTAELDTDENVVVQEIISCIQEGDITKMKLAEAVSKKAGTSKRKVIRLIEKYSGEDPKIHKWYFKRGARGAQFFALLDTPEVPSSTPDI